MVLAYNPNLIPTDHSFHDIVKKEKDCESIHKGRKCVIRRGGQEEQKLQIPSSRPLTKGEERRNGEEEKVEREKCEGEKDTKTNL
jgi:hypothetical protein